MGGRIGETFRTKPMKIFVPSARDPNQSGALTQLRAFFTSQTFHIVCYLTFGQLTVAAVTFVFGVIALFLTAILQLGWWCLSWEDRIWPLRIASGICVQKAKISKQVL